jgi:hypothetical protein
MRSPSFPKPSWRFLQFLALTTTLLVAIVFLTWTYGAPTHIPLSIPLSIPGLTHWSFKHPIDELIAAAEADFEAVLAKEVKSLGAAAKAYRKRRGRHPPPGFEEWYNFTVEHGALVVEDFFDRIYDDLGPFWGIEPRKIRQQAHLFDFVVSVRNGSTTQKTDHERAWMNLWHQLIGTIEKFLPDVDVPINTMDESRLLVPWETVSDYMNDARHTMPPASDVISELSGLADLNNSTFDWKWQGPHITWPDVEKHPRPYWSLVRAACAPDTPTRKTPVFEDIWSDHPRPEHAAALLLPTSFPPNTLRGYVQNWTQATDPCYHPHLQGLHGTFVEPISLSASEKLFPLFGGSKLPMNNEILLPAAMYWSDMELYSGGEESHGLPWPEKNNSLIWRGAATGGRNKKENWPRFQRHRFLSMVNGTQVSTAELPPGEVDPSIAGIGLGGNFRLPPGNPYEITAASERHLGDWIGSFSNAKFMDLVCFPGEDAPTCSYTNEFYSVTGMMPMKEQYAYKYLPDIDGNSFSGRYRGFLRSTSLPIKATIYKEWHDSRLFPWVHFVPMDNTFIDFYGIMEYFIGSDPKLTPAAPLAASEPEPEPEPAEEPEAEERLGGESPEAAEKRSVHKEKKDGHDEAARKIAERGQKWAEMVLRREDMQIYVYRLLLEYARVCDDRRERLGFVEDLKAV